MEVDLILERVLNRVLKSLSWRIDRRARRRLDARAPGEIELHGVRLDLSESWATPTLRKFVYDGLYEVAEATIIEATMRPGDRVMEIGCGVGFLTTIASRIVGNTVRAYEANPQIVSAAERTITRNGADATVITALLQNDPADTRTTFYVHDDFWTSSIIPNAEAAAIEVPVLDLIHEITELDASYLMIDVEGGETDLLLCQLPSCVRKLCLECHPAVAPATVLTAMLMSVLSQGFALDLSRSLPPVLYFER